MCSENRTTRYLAKTFTQFQYNLWPHPWRWQVFQLGWCNESVWIQIRFWNKNFSQVQAGIYFKRLNSPRFFCELLDCVLGSVGIAQMIFFFCTICLWCCRFHLLSTSYLRNWLTYPFLPPQWILAADDNCWMPLTYRWLCLLGRMIEYRRRIFGKMVQ